MRSESVKYIIKFLFRILKIQRFIITYSKLHSLSIDYKDQKLDSRKERGKNKACSCPQDQTNLNYSKEKFVTQQSTESLSPQKNNN